MKTLLLLILSLFIGTQEQTTPQPDRWRNLVLNESTPADASRILGQPASDKVGDLKAYRIQQWLSKKAKEKIFRVLEFKSPEGIDKARLFFLEEKLIAIDLDLKKEIAPGALSNIYAVEFQPAVGAADIAFNPRQYETNQGRVYPKTYPTVYAMVAISERSFISAMVTNVPSFGGALARSAGVSDQPGTFPGKVKTVTLVSRVLENRDGADVLK